MNIKTLAMAAVMAVSSVAATGCSSNALNDAAQAVDEATSQQAEQTADTATSPAEQTADAATNWLRVRTWFAPRRVVVARAAVRPVARVYASRVVRGAPARRVWVAPHYSIVAGRRVLIAGRWR